MALLFVTGTFEAIASTPPADDAKAVVDTQGLLLRYQASPLVFERNAGQTDARVDFLARGANYQLFLTGPDATVKLTRRDPAHKGGAELASGAMRVRWLGTQPARSAAGMGELAGRSHYIRGADASASIADIATYERVGYSGVYPGVDLVYYARQGQLEYDLIVAPGADPKRIRFAVEGARRTSLDRDGNLVAQTGAGDVMLHRPVVYQTIHGERRHVAARYARDGSGAYRIALADYDKGSELVIDPVLSYGTYLGGSTLSQALSVAVDASGSAYVAGFTTSADFPVVSAYKSTFSGAGSTDAFVTKFNPAGSQLVYSTYLGATPARRSTTYQRISAIAVDAAGSAYVTGTTNSASFPTTAGAYQAGVTGGGSFVAKLAPSGSSLAYSTYLLDATPTAVAVDGLGNVYLTGIAFSTFTTTPGSFQPTYKGEPGGTNALVASLNATGSALRYATYLGGSASDAGNGIAVDVSGNAVVAGDTTSTNFPTTALAYQGANASKSDGFITKMNATGTGLVFSTYFGGSLTDRIDGVALDPSGAVYVVGSTYSPNLPSRNAFQPVKSGRNLVNSSLGNVFVAKLQPAGDALAYASFLGGEVCVQCQSSFGLQEYTGDYGQGIAVDATGHAYITGIARSYTFPLLNSLIQNQGRDQELQHSAFLAKIGSAGNSVLYNTLTTTDADQEVFAVAVDPAGNAYGAGTALRPGLGGSIDLVAPGSFSPTPKPGNPTSALLYKLASATPAMTLTTSANPSTSQAPVTLTARVADTGVNGSVLFFDGHMLLGSAQLASGTAAFTTPLWPGVRRLTAVLRAPDVATDTALLYQVVNPSLVCH
jgi:hypothetical protein